MSKSSSGRGIRGLVTASLVLAALFFSVLVGVVFISDSSAQPVCNQTGAAVSVDLSSVPAGPVAGYGHDQLVNAANVMLAAQKLGLTVRDQTIGVMTAMGESSLTVLDRGDLAGPDSRGLFQQRDNGAWGSYSDRMDPFISATNFFKKEMTVQGRESMDPTLVAHTVQGNADPYYYTPFWQPAQTVVQALGGVTAQPGATASGAAPQTNSSYATAGMKPQTVVVANTLGQQFHIKTIGGYRPNAGPYDDPLYGHATGLAIDFMINDLPDGKATGDALAHYLQQHADELGVQYVIWQQHIWSPARADEGWRPMPDRGSPTENHMDHVHLSLNGKGGTAIPAGGTGTGQCPASGPATGQIGEVSLSGWAAPARGPITSPFGPRVNPVTGVSGIHTGIDIGAPCDAPIYAANNGTVVQAGPSTGYGNLITVDHGSDLVTRYAHMFDNGLLVKAGDQVKAGQQIARVGTYGNSTGCHLHFEVKQAGQFLDPAAFLAKVGVSTN